MDLLNKQLQVQYQAGIKVHTEQDFFYRAGAYLFV